jgi:hypothetical protein
MVYLVKLTDRQLETLKLGADPLNYPLKAEEVVAMRDTLRTLQKPLPIETPEQEEAVAKLFGQLPAPS